MRTFKNSPLLVFLFIAFLVGTPSLFLSTLGSPAALQVPLFLLGSYGVALAAWFSLRRFHLQDEAQAWRSRLRTWRVGAGTYLLAILLPSGAWLLSCCLYWGENKPEGVASWTSLLVFPMVFLVNWGEEAGWRGFALPRLMASYKPLHAGLILGLVWGLFHLPLYWQRPLFAVLFLALAPALSVILTWLFLRSSGSVLLCTLFHATYNTWGSVFLPAGGEPLLVVVTGLAWLVALALVLRSGVQLSGERGLARVAA